MKRRGLTPDGQTLEGLISGAEKSQEEFQKVEAGKVVVSERPVPVLVDLHKSLLPLSWMPTLPTPRPGGVA